MIFTLIILSIAVIALTVSYAKLYYEYMELSYSVQGLVYREQTRSIANEHNIKVLRKDIARCFTVNKKRHDKTRARLRNLEGLDGEDHKYL